MEQKSASPAAKVLNLLSGCLMCLTGSIYLLTGLFIFKGWFEFPRPQGDGAFDFAMGVFWISLGTVFFWLRHRAGSGPHAQAK